MCIFDGTSSLDRRENGFGVMLLFRMEGRKMEQGC